ncbi:MAG: sugar ABC transporter permease [Clostridia bacterium]|nr:sugar ABC transporter permease [Clostridia bacterium]
MKNTNKLLCDRSSVSYKAKRLFKRNWSGWLLMLPGLLLFLFFVWAPLAQNVVLSFSETKGFESVGFNNFENYTRVFHDPLFTKALLNTFKYIFWSIIIGFLVPIFLGLLLSEVVHLKSFIRLGIYFPSIVSGIAVVIMWSYLLDPNPGAVLNQLLSALGIPASQFLSNPKLTIPLIVVTMTWRGAGGTVLVYLSALQNIDNSQYEAARMDGAGAMSRIWHVTLPHIKPTIRMLFILQIISVFQVFYEPLVMTSGGPDGASVSLLLLSYQYAFKSFDAGASAATGVILAVIIIALTIVYLRLSKPKKDKVARKWRKYAQTSAK